MSSARCADAFVCAQVGQHDDSLPGAHTFMSAALVSKRRYVACIHWVRVLDLTRMLADTHRRQLHDDLRAQQLSPPDCTPLSVHQLPAVRLRAAAKPGDPRFPVR